ncbi:MAG: hypothetical protein AAFU79_10415, partial [Myxococcota bacterium]
MEDRPVCQLTDDVFFRLASSPARPLRRLRAQTHEWSGLKAPELSPAREILLRVRNPESVRRESPSYLPYGQGFETMRKGLRGGDGRLPRMGSIR